MAKHRRLVRSVGLTANELIAISLELRQRNAALPSYRVQLAVREAMDLLAGLVTTPQHLYAIVRMRAAAELEGFLEDAG